ncbi:hypothetical protein [Ligilactobacillus equi]|uniref:Uncharacterized protein n=1 Tax=Ligilactobacillus equi DSM 15833 = JCM 10991 TaxID=1423740 RepID=A0A0R1TSJ5_9LACO|nr:hypothetical protein [Ligilactobacillus equi]KRL81786.1 hypothetical protein FC36_GL001378 [Ligilactobacillus equi DSM 15833 = JCM 10991]
MKYEEFKWAVKFMGLDIVEDDEDVVVTKGGNGPGRFVMAISKKHLGDMEALSGIRTLNDDIVKSVNQLASKLSTTPIEER